MYKKMLEIRRCGKLAARCAAISCIMSIFLSITCHGEQTMQKEYLDANRLKYHGCFYKNDVLKNKKN